MEYDNEEKSDQEDMGEDQQSGSMKQWLQDNLRILVSVLIVVVIAAGIYSYSNRADSPTTNNEEENSIISEITGDEEKDASENMKPDETPAEKKEVASQENVPAPKQDKAVSAATSQETETSFVETAARGDSATKLARRALANYLEKNADSSLKPEHKIYIEDYLRKQAAPNKRILVGTSVEFSKNMIQDAISKSKNLNERQLQNLHKYAVRVPSLA